jgi:hypothetical protein
MRGCVSKNLAYFKTCFETYVIHAAFFFGEGGIRTISNAHKVRLY